MTSSCLPFSLFAFAFMITHWGPTTGLLCNDDTDCPGNVFTCWHSECMPKGELRNNVMIIIYSGKNKAIDKNILFLFESVDGLETDRYVLITKAVSYTVYMWFRRKEYI